MNNYPVEPLMADKLKENLQGNGISRNRQGDRR